MGGGIEQKKKKKKLTDMDNCSDRGGLNGDGLRLGVVNTQDTVYR